LKRNAPAVLALGVALAAIGGLALLSLTERDERAPTRPDESISPRTTVNAPLLERPTRATLAGPEREVAPTTSGGEAFTFHGYVRNADGGAVVAADVRLTLRIGDAERSRLGETLTGPDGSFSLESAAPLTLVPERRAAGLVVVNVSATGYRPSTAEAALSTDTDTQELTVVLDAGGKLTGRVFAGAATGIPTGVAVAGAEVALVVEGDLPGRDKRTLVHTTTTDESGSFELGFVSGGNVMVHVRAPGVGSALVAEVSVQAGTDKDLGDIALVGTGVLGGRVTYPNGEPAKALELWAVPGAFAGRAHALALARREVLAREEGLGLTLARTHTEKDGSFHFGGLAGGDFTILTERSEQSLAPLGASYATGSESVALVLGARRLRIVVRATDNRPLPGAKVTLTPLAEDERGTRVAGPAQHAIAHGAEASCDFEAPAGTPLVVRVTAQGCHPVDERILLEQGERERLHTIVMHPADTSGTIRLDVCDERGVPFENLRVWILAESSGLPVPGFDGVAPDEDHRVGPLPPGLYGVAVWPQAAASGDNLAFPVEADTPVEVAPNAETFLPLVARSGG
jgi:hypothetical protein